MLYVIYGTDTDKAREKAGMLRDALQKKKPDASLFTLSADEVSAEKLDELSSGQGLFENKYIVFADKILENKDIQATVFEKLAAIKDSPNVFIMLEGKLLKEAQKKLEKHAEKMEAHDLSDKPQKESGEIFALADALGRRDKKSLWVLYRKAIDNDAVPEEIHGILWWQVKSIMLAKTGLSPAETGLNPYVYSKAKGFAANFTDEEIEGVLSSLIRMYHDAHRGKADFEIALEKFALDL
jgi:DNA polymerase III delta subunit